MESKQVSAILVSSPGWLSELLWATFLLSLADMIATVSLFDSVSAILCVSVVCRDHALPSAHRASFSSGHAGSIFIEGKFVKT